MTLIIKLQKLLSMAMLWIRGQPRLVVAARKVFGVLGHEGIAGILARIKQSDYFSVSYSRWIKSFDTIRKADREAIRAHMESFRYRPLISVLMPVYNTPERWLQLAIESVRAQIYPHWELCIADDCSTAAHVRRILETHAAADSRIRLVFRDSNGHISAASNSALAMARGEFIALLDHDDELPEHAIYMVAAVLNDDPDLDLIFSDEDKFDEWGKRFGPYFKGDWSPDLLRGQNMVSHLGVYRTSLVQALGGFREGFEGCQDWDLALRVAEKTTEARIRHIPHVLYHWRTIAGSTAAGLHNKTYVVSAGRRALEEHLQRLGLRAEVIPVVGAHFRIKYVIPTVPPLVSIIVSAGNDSDLLRRCIESIRDRTAYRPFELLIVNHGSAKRDTTDYLKSLQLEGRASVLRYDGHPSHSTFTNFAVAQARGQIVCLFSNHLEVLTPDWLEEMVSHALRSQIGAVGAMLYYPNGTIRHAGLTLGMGGVAGHVYHRRLRGEQGYMSRACLVQNLSAITGDCLVVRKNVFEEVGGLDGANLPNAYWDVDLCLRILERGYRNLWTPYAELRHYGSSDGKLDRDPDAQAGIDREAAYMQSRWGKLLLRDSAYNPNLSLDHTYPHLAWHPRVDKLWRN